MEKHEDALWHPLSWFCSVCGSKVTAYQNKKGEFKVTCSRCKSVMIRIPKGRGDSFIKVYKNDGDELRTG